MTYVHHSWEKREISSLISNRILTDSQDNQPTHQSHQPQTGGDPCVHANAYHIGTPINPTYIHIDSTGILASLRYQEKFSLLQSSFRILYLNSAGKPHGIQQQEFSYTIIIPKKLQKKRASRFSASQLGGVA